MEADIDHPSDPDTSAPSPGDDAGHVDDVVAVQQAQAMFYEAFEAADLDAMSALWEHSGRVTCVHPGWPARRGWGAVAASWMTLFQGPDRLQFLLTEEQVEVVGDIGWVTVDENLLSGATGATVAALNVFLRTEHGWRLVAHHGSSLAG